MLAALDTPPAHRPDIAGVPARHVPIVTVAPTLLSGAAPRRKPLRPPAFRIDGFDEKYDFDTLFFDAFFDAAGCEVIAVGPPLLNLRPALARMRMTALPSGTPCRFRIKEMDRHAQVRIAVPLGTERLAMCSDIGDFVVTLRANRCAIFHDRRVLFTLSKNNRLDWIQDWIRYNRDIHSADAVLIYDNASTQYAAAELAAAVAAVSGIAAAAVVSWPFKYGPQGLDAKRFWDSDYCQNGAWEHARHCFLGLAKSAMNADIDELVVSDSGASVFEAAERSPFGIMRYRGAWMPGIADLTRTASDQAPIRHRDFEYVLHPLRTWRWGVMPSVVDRCPPKWTVVPARCPDHAQWCAHNIKNWIAALPVTDRFVYRHFREINDNWKYDRSPRITFDSARHVRDAALARNYDKVDWTG
jgi:hypothetical protein